MKILLAIVTCHAFRARANSQRETWVKDLPEGLDLKFFLGYPAPNAFVRPPTVYSYKARKDEVLLDAPDGYFGLPLKVQAMFKWAYEMGYDWVAKADDDAYIAPDRVLKSVPDVGHGYAGRTRGPSGGFPAPYNSGFFYWLDRRSMRVVINSKWTPGMDAAEDRWVGNTLLKENIRAWPDYRHMIVKSAKNGISGKESPRCDNTVISACEFNDAEMKAAHNEYKYGCARPKALEPRREGPLSRVSIMVKTFLRDGYLFAALRGIETTLPECRIIVVDDGYEHRDKIARYAEMRDAGHTCLWMPFDSGFGDKANEAVRNLKTDYVLIGSDDFDFANPSVRSGIEKMVKVLDANPGIGVCSGRVNDRPYEFLLERKGSCIKEVKGYRGEGEVDGAKFKLCDLTVNWSLIRKEVFESGVAWDGGDVKIGGGEHAAFFLDIAEKGWKVAVVEGAPIWELGPPGKYGQHRSYNEMRARAKTPGRPCLLKRGITEYMLASGQVEKS